MNEGVNTNKGKRQLLLLALVFFGPLLLAIIMYFTGNTIREAQTVNNGTFITPPLTLDDKLHFDTGTRGRWTLVYKTTGDCDDICEKALIDIRQIRLATGREIDRIERLLITDEAPTNHQLIINSANVTDFDSADVPFNAAVGELANDKLYIMDPLGNVILHYAPAPDRKAFLADLKKLLKASRIG